MFDLTLNPINPTAVITELLPLSTIAAETNRNPKSLIFTNSPSKNVKWSVII